MAAAAIGGDTESGLVDLSETGQPRRERRSTAFDELSGHKASARWAGAACALLVVVAVALPVAGRVWARWGDVSDGALTAPNSPPWRSSGVTLAHVGPTRAGLHEGDLIIAVDGRSLQSWLEDPDRLGGARPRPGDHLRYTVVRDGRQVDVDVVLGRFDLREAVVGNPAAAPLAVLILAVAGFVFLCRPKDRSAQVLLAVAALVAFGASAAPYVQVVDVVRGRFLPFLAERLAMAAMWGAVGHFALTFPEPWLPLRWRRRAVAAVYGGPFVIYGVFLAITLPGTDGHPARVARLVSVSYGASRLYPLVVGGLMYAGFRAARSGTDRRRQRAVLLTFVVSLSLYMGLGQVPSILFGRPLISERFLPLLFLPCPVVIGAAVLRYRMYDIQVIVRRSLLYGSLTAAVFGTYFAALAFTGRTVGGPSTTVLLVASGLITACVPFVRDQLQRLVSRLVYGDRDDPHEVVSRLGERLEGTARAEAVLPGIVETLAQALRLPYVAIELHRGDETLEVTASHGRTSGTPLCLELSHRGERVGRLLLEVKPGSEPFGPADRRLLDDVARQVAVTAHGVLLHSALERTLTRVVTAREEERRRLQRDLHDGLGPTLAAGALQLHVARGLVHQDPGAAESLLDRIADEMHDAISDVRSLVHGLRPAMLDELGLDGAIRRRASDLRPHEGASGEGGLNVEVEVDGDVDHLPAAVEVAAYNIAVEALNNAARHGRASACTVRLAMDGDLELTVHDDGCGLPAAFSPGVGLASMRERAAELGGVCVVGRHPAGGTVVRARIPLSGGI